MKLGRRVARLPARLRSGASPVGPRCVPPRRAAHKAALERARCSQAIAAGVGEALDVAASTIAKDKKLRKLTAPAVASKLAPVRGGLKLAHCVGFEEAGDELRLKRCDAAKSSPLSMPEEDNTCPAKIRTSNRCFVEFFV